MRDTKILAKVYYKTDVAKRSQLAWPPKSALLVSLGQIYADEFGHGHDNKANRGLVGVGNFWLHLVPNKQLG